MRAYPGLALVALVCAGPVAAEELEGVPAKPPVAKSPVPKPPAPKPPTPPSKPQAASPQIASPQIAPPKAAAPAAPPTPVATFDVVTQENLLWAALANGDQAAVGGLLAEDVVLVGRDGLRRKADFLTTLSQCRISAVQVSDTVRRPLTADVTGLAYRVRYQASCQGQQVAGDQTETSIWMRQGPSWRLVLHTEIATPPPPAPPPAP